MQADSRIYVAGHRGLVGSALLRALEDKGHRALITETHADLDLTDATRTEAFFARRSPEYVFLAAARVGGIVANDTHPAEFIRDNLAIQTNVIHAAWKAGVKRLLFLGSSCIYPRLAPQPIPESSLLTGPLEPTNRAYALAKIAGIEMCWSYNRQYGTRYLAAMPTNLYGPADNYHPEHSHVIPALLRRFHAAKVNGDRAVVVWGSGTPRREFLYSDDMADACVHLMNLPDASYDALLGSDESEVRALRAPVGQHRVRRGCQHRPVGRAGARDHRFSGRHQVRRKQARRHAAQAPRCEHPDARRLACAHAAGHRIARGVSSLSVLAGCGGMNACGCAGAARVA